MHMQNEQPFLDSLTLKGDEPAEALQHFLLDYKLIIRKDSTFDMVLFKKYTHGTWSYNGQSKTLVLSDELSPANPIDLQVDSITPANVLLRVNQATLNRIMPAYGQSGTGFSFLQNHGPYFFVLSADKDKVNNQKEDPYSKQNNLWRIKPSKAEDDDELNARVRNHVEFVKQLMQNVVDGRQTYISLHSFRTPLVISSDDIRVQPYNDITDGWNENFYDSTEAKKGYDLLLNAIVGSNMKPAAGDDRFQNNVAMLNELLAHLRK